jgi:hypothetical protein
MSSPICRNRDNRQPAVMSRRDVFKIVFGLALLQYEPAAAAVRLDTGGWILGPGDR